MYVIARLYGNREKQIEWHQGLRAPLKNLIDSGVIKRFVMTYHGDKLYLCLESLELIEDTLEHLMVASSFSAITNYLIENVGEKSIETSNYEFEVRDSILATLRKKGVQNPSDAFVSELTKRQIDNASRGSKAAMEILSQDPADISDWNSLTYAAFKKCHPLNEGWFISDSAHFCFNSLGLSNQEEVACRSLFEVINSVNSAVRNLFDREDWKT